MAEQIRIDLDRLTLAALPAGWDDERSEATLWGEIARALIDDAPFSGCFNSQDSPW